MDFYPAMPHIFFSYSPMLSQNPISDMDVVKYLPDKEKVLYVINIMTTLSTRASKSLGDWDIRYQYDREAIAAENRLKTKLKYSKANVFTGKFDPKFRLQNKKCSKIKLLNVGWRWSSVQFRYFIWNFIIRVPTFLTKHVWGQLKFISGAASTNKTISWYQYVYTSLNFYT